MGNLAWLFTAPFAWITKLQQSSYPHLLPSGVREDREGSQDFHTHLVKNVLPIEAHLRTPFSGNKALLPLPAEALTEEA